MHLTANYAKSYLNSLHTYEATNWLVLNTIFFQLVINGRFSLPLKFVLKNMAVPFWPNLIYLLLSKCDNFMTMRNSLELQQHKCFCGSNNCHWATSVANRTQKTKAKKRRKKLAINHIAKCIKHLLIFLLMKSMYARTAHST